MKNLFKNPLFYINVFLLVLLILLSASINPNSTNLPYFAKKALAAVQFILGEGTVNYLAAFTGANQIGNSIIYDTGANIGIGTTGPSQKLDVVGNVSANDYWIGAAGKWASQMGGGVVLVYSCPNQRAADESGCIGQLTLESFCYWCNWQDQGSCKGWTTKPCIPVGQLVGLPIFLNSATGLTCTQVCANKGYASCKSVGLDAYASDGNYKFGFGTYCTTFGNGDCNSVMSNMNTVCSGHTADWTNCLCQ